MRYAATISDVTMSIPQTRRIKEPSLGHKAALISVEVLATCISLMLNVHVASAQTGEAVAESLFREGKRLFQADDFGHACPKLAQSYQIDPAGGTVLLLAICYERQGKLASSWARYNDALAIARHDRREDRERRAREGLESVEPKLSYIELKLDPATQAISGVTLAIDGTELPAISDAKLPVNSGKHKLAVHAPNYDPWSAEITVGGPSVTESVLVPPLQARPVPTTAKTVVQPVQRTATSDTSTSSARERAHRKNVRTIAYVMGGAGLAAVAVGSYFGVRAIGLNNDANTICPAKQCTQDKAAAVGKSDDAVSNAHLADVFVGIGSAVTLSAVVLWAVYRNDPPSEGPYAAVVPHTVSLGWRQSF